MSAIFKHFKPNQEPARYVYKDPDTGRAFEENSKSILIQTILQYRQNNQLKPIENLLAVLDNFWCELPENAGRCINYNLQRGLLATIKGGMALIADVTMPSHARVTQEEAEKRAEICKKCIYNGFPDKDGFIKHADWVVDTYLDRSKTHNKCEKSLGNCAVCSCILNFKVHVKGPFDVDLDEIQKAKMRDVGCWQVKDH